MINEKPKWTVIMKGTDVDRFNNEDYHLIDKKDTFFSREYKIVYLEATSDLYSPYTEEALYDLPALAIHEEWSKEIVIREDALDTVKKTLYGFKYGLDAIISDMLTGQEKAASATRILIKEYGIDIEKASEMVSDYKALFQSNAGGTISPSPETPIHEVDIAEDAALKVYLAKEGEGDWKEKGPVAFPEDYTGLED